MQNNPQSPETTGQPSEIPGAGTAGGADCLFCRIVAGEIPAKVVAETGSTLAFRDIAPAAPTHILVIPKMHYADLGAAMAADPAVGQVVLEQCASLAATEGLAKGYRVVINTGPYGGQTVGHLHAHLLGGRSHGWPPG